MGVLDNSDLRSENRFMDRRTKPILKLLFTKLCSVCPEQEIATPEQLTEEEKADKDEVINGIHKHMLQWNLQMLQMITIENPLKKFNYDEFERLKWETQRTNAEVQKAFGELADIILATEPRRLFLCD